jgi:hypothetical protein
LASRLLWSPQLGPQHALVNCPFREVFLGGARGGGKTDGVLGHWLIKEQRYGAAFNAIMLRKTATSSEDAIERSKELYGPLGGRFNSARNVWRMPNGGRVSFGYLDGVQDANQYQGRNLTDVWVEEVGQYESPAPIDRMFAALRSSKGVPTQLVLTGNPGGAGQHWLRERYHLAPFPKGPKVYERLLPNGETHKYAVIPSRVTDNQILLKSDPHYLANLQMSGSKELVRAWLDGDWTAVLGAFFDDWSEAKHVIEPFEIPSWWMRLRSMDWGSASPASIGWWAVVSDDYELEDGRTLPRGCLVRYREWYTAEAGSLSNGLKLSAEEIAKGILERQEQGEAFDRSVLDPAAFAQNGGPSIAERMWAEGVSFEPADNTRIGKRGHAGGWDQMRSRLKGDDWPMIACFSTCRSSIETIPTLQHDPIRAEDLDTNSVDHAADDWRYACMARPWIREAPKPKHTKIEIKPLTLNDLQKRDDAGLASREARI